MAIPPPPTPEHAVTIRDIAARCGVSVATVSRALRNPAAQHADTSARILAVAQELGYDPDAHHAARRLSLHRHGKAAINNLIALFLPPHYYQAGFFAELFAGVMAVMTAEGYGLITLDTYNADNPLANPEWPPCLGRGDVDGMIVYSTPEDFRSQYDRLRVLPSFGDRPIVFLVKEAEAPYSAVILDNPVGACAAATHLLTLGHRHLLHLCGRDIFSNELRPQHLMVAGYHQALCAAGLSPATHLHVAPLDAPLWELAMIPSNLHRLSALGTVRLPESPPLIQRLRAHPEITAILAPNDPAACIIYHLLLQHGIRVPDDISLVGFDDTFPLYNAQWDNILTTLRSPLHRIGETAAHLVIDQITGRRQSPPLQRLAPALVVRATTAPPAPSGAPSPSGRSPGSGSR
jgi:LacI family transcriptional regulator